MNLIYHLMKCLLSAILILGSLVFSFSQHTWLGGTGDYNDPSKWDTETVPSTTDSVIINSGTIHIPATYTALARGFNAKNCTIDFQSSGNDHASIEIYGDLIVESSVTLQYTFNSQSKWILKGDNRTHRINSNGIDLLRLEMDETTASILLQSELLASKTLRLRNGNLTSIGHDITTQLFAYGGGCSMPSNCFSKNIHLESCVVTCTLDYNANSNFGSATVTGSYTIRTPRFSGGRDISYDNVVLTDYDYLANTSSQHNLSARDNIFQNLTLDSDFTASFDGNFQVNGVFTVIESGGTILISEEQNSDTDEWKLNGSVVLPAPGPCGELTTFKRRPTVSDAFIFSTTSAQVTFDHAFIQAIRTSGGTFVVQEGKVSGFNDDWTVSNTTTGKTLYYIGGDGSWSDGNNWSETSGGAPSGCFPTILDDVVFDDNSFSATGQSVEIDVFENTMCNNLTWLTNPLGGSISSNYQPIVSPNTTEFFIDGNIDIDAQVTIDLEANGEMILLGQTITEIQSVADLPRVKFTSPTTEYRLTSDISGRVFDHEGGTINTMNHDVDLSFGWFTSSLSAKKVLLHDSEINVQGRADFGQSFENMDIISGASTITCDDFEGNGDTFNIVIINNTSLTELNAGGVYHKIVMNDGPLLVRNGDFAIDSLVLNSENADVTFQRSSFRTYSIRQTIISNAPAIPPTIASDQSTATDLDFEVFNACISGPIRWENINAIADGKVNSPEGVDGGGNQGLDFTATNAYSGTLYWRGGQEFWNTESNWSTNSGGCPATVSPEDANLLIFDDASFLPGDTLSINTFNFARDLLWTNTNSNPVVFLGRRLVPDNVTVNGGSFILANNTSIEPFGTLWLDISLKLENGGQITLDNTDIVVGRRPNFVVNEALSIDATSGINGSGNLAIAGTSPTPSIFAASISSSSPSDFTDIDFQILNPISGQPLRDMRFNLGGKHFKSLSTFSSGVTRRYTFTNLAYFTALDHNHGELWVEDSAFFFIQDPE